MWPKPKKRSKSYAKRKRHERVLRYLGLKHARLRRAAEAQGRKEALCEVCDENLGLELHHVRGRLGDELFNVEEAILVCRSCHDRIEHDREWARKEGYLKSRHGKEP